jgi:hypothetical protein
MTKIVVGMSMSMSMSVDGIAGPDVPDEDGMALFAEEAVGQARSDLDCVEAIQGEGALHLRYQIR